MVKNAFYFMLKALFFHKILHFCLEILVDWDFVEKLLDKKAMVNFKIYDITDWTTNNYNTHTA